MSSIIDFIILTHGKDIQHYNEYFKNLNLTIVPLNRVDNLFTLVDQLKRKTQFRVWIHLEAMAFDQQPYPGIPLGEQLLEKHNDLKFQFLTRKTLKSDESEIKGIKVYELTDIDRKSINSVPVNTKEEVLTDVCSTEEISQNSFQSELPPAGAGGFLEQQTSLCPSDSRYITRLESGVLCGYNNKFDIAILTALHDDEFENIKQAFDLKENKDFDSGTKAMFYTGFVKNSSEKKLSIVAVFQSDTGMVDAATLTAIINSMCKPKYFVMTGVCGGNPEKQDIKFGDIIVPKKVFYFEKGKQSEKGFEPEFESCDIDNLLIQQIETNKVRISRKIMDSDTSRANRYRNGPPISVLTDPMATSTFVMNEEGLFNELIASRDRKSAAVDMEGYAVARACKLQNTKAIIIKAVMDKTMNKDDTDKSLAAYNSAQFLKHLIRDVLEF